MIWFINDTMSRCARNLRRTVNRSETVSLACGKRSETTGQRGYRKILENHPGELPVGSNLAHFGSGCTYHTGRGHIDILKLKTWGPGRLIGFSAVVFLLASLVAIVPTPLILDKSVQLDGGGTKVFVSFEGHPECGAVLEYVGSADMEAGEVVSGDAGPCESRNLVIRGVQVVLVLALFVLVFSVGATWLMYRQTYE